MKIIISLLIAMLPVFAVASDNEDVTAIYKKIVLDKPAVALTPLGNAEEVDELLIATNEIEDGDYKVKVTRIGDHIYKIDGTSYYIKMPYCYEYSYGDEVILCVKPSYLGFKIGTLIWIDD